MVRGSSVQQFPFWLAQLDWFSAELALNCKGSPTLTAQTLQLPPFTSDLVVHPGGPESGVYGRNPNPCLTESILNVRVMA